MTNFYLDNADILFHMDNIQLNDIIKLKEHNFAEKDIYLEAPKTVEDAVDNYSQVLDIVGEIAGEFIAPRAEEVDPRCGGRAHRRLAVPGELLRLRGNRAGKKRPEPLPVHVEDNNLGECRTHGLDEDRLMSAVRVRNR